MQTATLSSTQKMNFRVVVLLEEKNRTKWEVGEVQHVWKSMLYQMMEYHNMNTSNNSSPQTLHVPREQKRGDSAGRPRHGILLEVFHQ